WQALRPARQKNPSPRWRLRQSPLPRLPLRRLRLRVHRLTFRPFDLTPGNFRNLCSIRRSSRYALDTPPRLDGLVPPPLGERIKRPPRLSDSICATPS